MKIKNIIIIFSVALLLPIASKANEGRFKNDRIGSSKMVDIIDTASASAHFTTLIAALQAADLTKLLKSKGPFTIFAPTDEAFSKLPREMTENLLKPENKSKLQSILTYHVIYGELVSSDTANMDSIKTANGKKLRFSKSEDGLLMVNSAIVTKANTMTSNGIIHVIDRVIVPVNDSR